MVALVKQTRASSSSVVNVYEDEFFSACEGYNNNNNNNNNNVFDVEAWRLRATSFKRKQNSFVDRYTFVENGIKIIENFSGEESDSRDRRGPAEKQASRGSQRERNAIGTREAISHHEGEFHPSEEIAWHNESKEARRKELQAEMGRRDEVYQNPLTFFHYSRLSRSLVFYYRREHIYENKFISIFFFIDEKTSEREYCLS